MQFEFGILLEKLMYDIYILDNIINILRISSQNI